MRTTAQDVAEAEILHARLLALHAEKARIDAEIAATTKDLRRLFEDQLLEDFSSSPADRPIGSFMKRRRTNLADTTTATSIACLLRISDRAAHRLVRNPTSSSITSPPPTRYSTTA